MADLKTTWKRRSPARLRRERRELVVVHSPDAAAVGRVLPLGAEPLVLGRDAGAPGQVGDPHLSRRHARITAHPSGLGHLVEDLGGANGTFLDGEPLKQPRVLGAHSVLCLGETLLVLDAEPDPEAIGAPAVAEEPEAPELVGRSLAARALRRAAAGLAQEPGPVLILGPSGAGKEVLARAIHRLSGRETFLAANCAAIPAELAESQLFGHKRGAFTGAERDRAGLFERAQGGTLFLDELGELPPAVQAKLLRVLEDGSYTALGDDEPRRSSARVLAATNADLGGGGFRQDLFARLSDWIVRVPPLAERRADVLALFRHHAPGAPELDTDVAEALLLHDWPLNVRELAKLAQRVSRGAGPLDLSVLPRALAERITARAAGEERGDEPPSPAVLERALKAAGGSVKLAAERNGWHRTQLYRWLRRAGIDPERFR